MMPAKVAVPRDTDAIRKRVRKLAAMDRIADEDCKYITDRLDEIDARVITMPESGFDRREF